MQLLIVSMGMLGRMHIEERLNEEPRLQLERKYANEIKQNKCNARENNTSSDGPGKFSA